MTNDMPLNDLRWIGYNLRAAAGAEEGSWRVRVAGNRRLAVSRRRSARVVPEASGAARTLRGGDHLADDWQAGGPGAGQVRDTDLGGAEHDGGGCDHCGVSRRWLHFSW